MLFFSRKRIAADEKKEAEVRSIRRDLFRKVDKVTKSTHKVSDLLTNDGDIARNIFYATRGVKQK